jgi:AcrR family transcriptional regulator
MLHRSPVQSRAATTIARAVSITAEIIAEQGQDAVAFRTVSQRSGISSGSLLHHFGSLAGLTAAAHAQRYEQALATRIAAADDLLAQGGTRSATQVLPALLEQFLADGEQRDEPRRTRMQALAFARHHPALREHLRGLIVTARDRLAPILARAAEQGALPGRVDASAVAVLHQSYTAGRVTDMLLDEPLPAADWSALFQAVVISGFTLPPDEDHLRLRPEDGAAVVEVLRDPDGARGLAWADADEERVVARARDLLRDGGPEAVVARRLFEDTGVSPGWFWRHFTGREELLDLLRLDALERYGRTEAEVIADLLDAAPTCERLTGHLAMLVGGALTADLREDWWDRVDLIVAATDRDVLRREVAPVLREQLATVAAAVRRNQTRGLVRADLSADAIARFLWGLPVAPLLADVAGFPRGPLAALAVTTLTGLTEEGRGGRG